MNLHEFSASLEALWRMHGTAYAWDELIRHLGEYVDAGAALWLLGRRRADREKRLVYSDDSDSNELDALWRFLGYELHQARLMNDSRSSGHPDDAKETGRHLAVLALAQSEVAGWYRADQDRRYGGDRPRRATPPGAAATDPGPAERPRPSSRVTERELALRVFALADKPARDVSAASQRHVSAGPPSDVSAGIPARSPFYSNEDERRAWLKKWGT